MNKKLLENKTMPLFSVLNKTCKNLSNQFKFRHKNQGKRVTGEEGRGRWGTRKGMEKEKGKKEQEKEGGGWEKIV